MKEALKKEVDKVTKKLILMGKSDSEITMEAISQELGMTAPTLYHYYKGKKRFCRVLGYGLLMTYTPLSVPRFPVA